MGDVFTKSRSGTVTATTAGYEDNLPTVAITLDIKDQPFRVGERAYLSGTVGSAQEVQIQDIIDAVMGMTVGDYVALRQRLDALFERA